MSNPLLHFCKFFANPIFDLESDFIIEKQMNHWFQRYIVPVEILSTFHTRVEYIFVLKYAIHTNGGEKLPKPPFPLGHVDVDPYLIHTSLDRPHSPPQMAYRSNQPFYHSTLSGQTDRQTHTLTNIRDRWQMCSHSVILIESNALIIIPGQFLTCLNRAEAVTRVHTQFIWWKQWVPDDHQHSDQANQLGLWVSLCSHPQPPSPCIITQPEGW